ncbi:hypothetical protein RPPS3_25420 [Rhodopseudomonas palustris]|uniref:hypothetical protein n=1 Tax=Rhodopseudomonas palustris TaxID=1076 RepID=UPI000D1AE6AA|nr:hypothetical protein [Rhodopseudomonas palustris]AVT76605.1 hypothetical protein RPPS3_25420 [Rhodopseudomonas palustris]
MSPLDRACDFVALHPISSVGLLLLAFGAIGSGAALIGAWLDTQVETFIRFVRGGCDVAT